MEDGGRRRVLLTRNERQVRRGRGRKNEVRVRGEGDEQEEWSVLYCEVE